jgi:hypothetical protein
MLLVSFHRAIFRTPASERLLSVIASSFALAFPSFAKGRHPHPHAGRLLA